MPKARILTVAMVLTLITAGCWDRQEIENTAFVMAVGVDKAEPPDRFKLTVEIAIPSQLSNVGATSQDEQRPTNWIVTSTGETIYDAVRNFTHQLPRQPQWYDLRLVVYGEELARDYGIHEALDLLDRNIEPRRQAWVLVSKGVPASEIMRTSVPISLLTAEAIDDMMNVSAVRSSTIVAKTLHNVYQMISAPGWEVYVSPITLIIEQDSTPDQGRLPQGPIPTHHPRVGGTAVFRGTHLIGWLDDIQTRGLLFARGEITSSVLVAPCAPNGGDTMSIQLISVNGQLTPVMKDGELTAKVTVEALGNIGEMYCNPRASINDLNEQFANVIEEGIRMALDAVQKDLGSDILGLGLKVYQQLPRVWSQVEEDWDAVFRTVPFEIEVKASLQRQGLVTSNVEVR